jgi:hypothetical protein
VLCVECKVRRIVFLVEETVCSVRNVLAASKAAAAEGWAHAHLKGANGGLVFFTQSILYGFGCYIFWFSVNSFVTHN